MPGDILAFIKDAHARGLSRVQIEEAVIAHFTLKQIMSAVSADKRAGWRVMDDAELLEFLQRREG
jgi:hypothetical protein